MRHVALIFTFILAGLFQVGECFAISSAAAREQARRLHIRIAGIPPSSADWDSMTSHLQQGRADLASFIAMANLRFYTSTIMNMFSPLASRVDLADQPLNDFTALVVGLIKNNRSFDQVLYGDILYVANDSIVDFDPATQSGLQTLIQKTGVNRGDAPAAGKVRPLMARNDATNLALYTDNRHYSDLQSRFVDWPSQLTEIVQSQAYSITAARDGILSGAIPANEVMGAWTTRQAMLEYISAGTNRRALKFAFRNMLCEDLPELHDITVSQEKIRQDIDRAPGGNPLTFVGTCAGCHAGMDALAGGLAYLSFQSNRIEYDSLWTTDRNNGGNACFNSNGSIKTPDQIAAIPRCKQYRQYTNFVAGHQVRDNSFKNFWVNGQNSKLGWRLKSGVSDVTEGSGANQLGRLLAATESFSSCMATRVFERVCNRAPSTSEIQSIRTKILPQFEGGSSDYSDQSATGAYNMRALFARISNYCFGNGE